MNHPVFPHSDRYAASWLITLGIVAGIGAVILSGCSLDAQFVAASRSTLDVIAPAHRDYVEHDENMTDEQRERRLRKLDSWEARISEAEIRLGDE